MDDRPAPSPEKLLNQFRDWMAAEELPGRTMSYLKTGFLDEILAEHDGHKGVPEMRAAWSGWEAGTTHPTVVLETLQAEGIEAFLVDLVGG